MKIDPEKYVALTRLEAKVLVKKIDNKKCYLNRWEKSSLTHAENKLRIHAGK